MRWSAEKKIYWDIQYVLAVFQQMAVPELRACSLRGGGGGVLFVKLYIDFPTLHVFKASGGCHFKSTVPILSKVCTLLLCIIHEVTLSSFFKFVVIFYLKITI